MALEISYFSLCFMLACNKIHENYFSRQLRQIQKSSQKSKRSDRFFVYVCPILNVMVVLGVLFMAFATDEFVDEVNETIE